MTATTDERTVGQMVVENPGRAKVFEQFGIDYCCGGGRTLAEACDAKGVEIDAIARKLAEYDQTSQTTQQDWSQASLTGLVDHIEQTHHAYLRENLPRLDHLVEKVAKVHGQRRPELIQLWRVFVQFHQEIYLHMMKEEQVLFPLCREMEQCDPPRSFQCGSVQNPIAAMEAEHDDAGDALEQMSNLTDDFAVPADACGSYRAMLHGLAELQRDTHQHVHKENNILFPRAIEVERRLQAAGSRQ